jgi:S1-C subfamily serine protease
MFSDGCKQVLGSVYALIGWSKGGDVNCGTSFMIAPGILATAAHVTYKNRGDSEALQDAIRVIAASEIDGKQAMESATVVAIDAEYDIALLKIENPRVKSFVTFATDPLPAGTDAGALGFPLMNPKAIMAGAAVPMLRFQGGHVSVSYAKPSPTSGRQLAYHETDMPMYQGSSGCPGFLEDGRVFGMHVAELHEGDENGNPKQRAFSLWLPASIIISFARDNEIETETS